MNQADIRHIKPFVSIALIILTLLTIVFLQMEERRMGYSILKLRRENKELQGEKRVDEIQLAKLSRPQHLENVAQNKFTLKRVQPRQVIHLPVAAGKGL